MSESKKKIICSILLSSAFPSLVHAQEGPKGRIDMLFDANGINLTNSEDVVAPTIKEPAVSIGMPGAGGMRVGRTLSYNSGTPGEIGCGCTSPTFEWTNDFNYKVNFVNVFDAAGYPAGSWLSVTAGDLRGDFGCTTVPGSLQCAPGGTMLGDGASLTQESNTLGDNSKYFYTRP